MMIKRVVLVPLVLFTISIVSLVNATAQEPSLIGTWAVTAADKFLPDGTRVADYGTNPHGLLIFTSDGYYSFQVYREDYLKFASGDKFNGTPEEYKRASLSASVHFGRYSVDPSKHTITFQVDRCAFPNWDESTQVRPYELKGDELSWKSAPRADGSVPVTVVRRVR
jgi:hypothetical protein